MIHGISLINKLFAILIILYEIAIKIEYFLEGKEKFLHRKFKHSFSLGLKRNSIP